jgi:hypothetical protein
LPVCTTLQASSPAVAIATTAGVGALAVVGTAVCIYLENLVLLVSKQWPLQTPESCI